MKKITLILIIVVATALLVPTTAMAGGTYWCTASGTTDGDGTYNNPWSCKDNTELQTVTQVYICAEHNGGVLYRMFPGYYVYYRITWYAARQCTVSTGTRYPGYPPYTGPDFPTPLVLSAAVAGGVILLAAGMLLRRKTNIN